MRYIKRFWDESRGDQYDSWGNSWWYFEIAEDDFANRQIEQYDNGTVLLYDREHMHDVYGGLADQPFTKADISDFEIEKDEFEAAWQKAKPMNR